MTKSIYETDYFQFELIDGNSQKKEIRYYGIIV